MCSPILFLKYIQRKHDWNITVSHGPVSSLKMQARVGALDVTEREN